MAGKKEDKGKVAVRLGIGTIIKYVFNLILIIIGILLIISRLSSIQRQSAENIQKKRSLSILQNIITSMEKNEREIVALTDQYNRLNQETLVSLGSLLNSDTGFAKAMATASSEERLRMFQDLADVATGDLFYIIATDGTVAYSVRPEEIGRNLSEKGFLSQQQIQTLTKYDANHYGTMVIGSDAVTYEPLEANVPGTDIKVSISSFPILSSYEGAPTGYFIIRGENTRILELETEGLRDIKTIIDYSSSDENALIFAIDANSGILLYSNQDDILDTGSLYTQSGLNRQVLENGWSGYQNIDGISYYCNSKTYSSENFGAYTVITAAVSSELLEQQNFQVLFWSILMFLTSAALILLYSSYLTTDLIKTTKIPEVLLLHKGKGTEKHNYYLNLTVLKKLTSIVLFDLILVSVVPFFAQTVSSLGNTAEKADISIGDLNLAITENNELTSEVYDYYTEKFVGKARMLALLLEEAPEIVFNYDESKENVFSYYDLDEKGRKQPIYDSYGNPKMSIGNDKGLQALCRDNSIFSIFVFDDEGQTMATNDPNWMFTLSMDPNDQSYGFRKVLQGLTNDIAQEARANDEGMNMQYFGSVFYYYTYLATDGSTAYASRTQFINQTNGDESLPKITRHRGVLNIGITADYADGLLAATDISHVFSSLVLDDGGEFLVFADDESHTVLYSEKEINLNKPASFLGFTDKAFNGKYLGFIREDGNEMFVTSTYTNGYFIATSTPTDSIYRERNRTFLYTFGICTAFLVFIALLTAINTNDEVEAQKLVKEDELHSSEFHTITMLMPDGSKKKVEPLTSRWASMSAPWGSRPPQAKIKTVIKSLMIAYFILIFIALKSGTVKFLESRIFGFILSNNWDKSINVFSLTVCGFCIMIVSVFTFALDLIITVFDDYVGTRVETIAKLVISIVKYGGVAGIIFYCLYSVGINSTSLIASAGILSLVIGLGAQSLIGDLLAGIFIALGGDFRVGDIITIDGFRGQVVDIGLRTTKIQDNAKNIKIYNNSQIRSVLNMTRYESVAAATISFDYGEKYLEIEELLTEALPPLMDKYPEILSSPVNLGITEIGDSGITIRVIASCTEQNRPKVERILNKELLLLFQSKGIQIPFPQVVVSDREKTDASAAAFKESLKK